MEEKERRKGCRSRAKPTAASPLLPLSLTNSIHQTSPYNIVHFPCYPLTSSSSTVDPDRPISCEQTGPVKLTPSAGLQFHPALAHLRPSYPNLQQPAFIHHPNPPSCPTTVSPLSPILPLPPKFNLQTNLPPNSRTQHHRPLQSHHVHAPPPPRPLHLLRDPLGNQPR